MVIVPDPGRVESSSPHDSCSPLKKKKESDKKHREEKYGPEFEGTYDDFTAKMLELEKDIQPLRELRKREIANNNDLKAAEL